MEGSALGCPTLGIALALQEEAVHERQTGYDRIGCPQSHIIYGNQSHLNICYADFLKRRLCVK